MKKKFENDKSSLWRNYCSWLKGSAQANNMIKTVIILIITALSFYSYGQNDHSTKEKVADEVIGRTGLFLKGQDLFYRLKVDASTYKLIPCGRITFENEDGN